MTSAAEQDHYEVLEVSRAAEAPEIERAYRVLQSIYVSDSLALYSVFDEADGLAHKERIDLAYRVLGDADSRRAYDEEADGWGADQDGTLAERAGDHGAGESRSSTAPATTDRSGPEENLAQELVNSAVEQGGAEAASGIEGFQDLEGDAEEDQGFDGARLRRARLQRGIEIDQIANVTKVSAAFLRSIEEETYDDLPAPVYVRGFVVAYARAIGLDPAKVVESYMARLEESKRGHRKGRLLGRL